MAEILEGNTDGIHIEDQGKPVEEMQSKNISNDHFNKDGKHDEQGNCDKMNKDEDLDSKAQEEMNETTKEDLAEEEPEPVFDGTEVPGMQANRSSSTRSLDLDPEEDGSMWPEKAVALKNFVKVKGAAVTSVLRRLSLKREGVEQSEDTSDSAKLGEQTAMSPRTAERSAWNPLNYIKVSRDTDSESKAEQGKNAFEESLIPIVTKGRIIFYTRLGCQECREARLFLQRKRLRYVEISIDVYPGRKLELEKVSGSCAVPKVFFNEVLIGGLSELKGLDESGKFDEKIDFLIAEEPSTEAPLPPLSGEDDVSGDGSVDELALIVRKMKATIVVKDRLYKMRRFTNCFLGSEAVDFLSEDQYLEREEAVDFGQKLGANLVLAYTGSSPVFMGKVMRIQKSQRKGKSRVHENEGLTAHERLLWREYKELMVWPNREIVQQLYVKHVMSPLLGPQHVDAGTRVHVTKEFLLSVEKNVTCRRPACRIDSSQVDVNRDSVLIISDHSVFMNGTLKGGPCITVEIKPKCGFLPISRFISEENAVKRTTTRFKMHQELKFHNQEISEYSEYNPLDLFSGSLDTICKAIEALYANPQNNFRVFLNGSIVFGGLGGGASSTTVLVGEAFEDALKDVIKAGDGLCKTSFIQLVAETVYTSGVLGQLLEVQKLDAYDIEGAIHAYYNIISQPCMVCRELSKDKLSNCHTSLHSITLDESLKIVKDYLLAATVKDCSLMISFRPMEDGEVLSGSSNSTLYLGSTKQVFEYKVFFIDLDLKPLKKMEDYYKLDKKIANCYCQMAKTEHKADKAARRDAYEKVLT